MISERELFDVVGIDKSFCPLLVSKKIGCSIKDVTDCIAFNDIKGRFVNGLWELQPKNIKWVVEICDTKYKRGDVLSPEFFWEYAISNNKVDQHNSVFFHDQEWLKAIKPGSVSGALGLASAQYLLLELDRKSHDNPIEKSMIDAREIIRQKDLDDYSMVFFSGNSSTHIYIDTSVFGNPMGLATTMCGKNKFWYNLAHLVAGDVRYKNGLVNSWTAHSSLIKEKAIDIFGNCGEITKMRQNLENIDPNIYSTNSLIRQPFSIHEKSGNLKEQIDLDESIAFGFPVSKLFNLPKQGVPFLLNLAVEAFHQVPEKKFHKPIESESEIISFYQKLLDIDPADASKDGWIHGLYNPFYEDTHPSLCINIKDGRFYDFGAPDFQFSFKTLKTKINNGWIKANHNRVS